jgi:hypothetical protein
MSSAAKEHLIESVTCTAAFAIIFGLIVSCGGGRSLSSIIIGRNAQIARIVSHLSPTIAAFPQSSAQSPLITMALQATPVLRPSLPDTEKRQRWLIVSIILLTASVWAFSRHLPRRYKIVPKHGGCWILTVLQDGSATSEPTPCKKQDGK